MGASSAEPSKPSLGRRQEELASQCSTSHEAAVLAHQDVVGPRGEYAFRLPPWAAKPLLRALQDPRDEPIVHLLGNQLLTAVPAAILLYVVGIQSHLVGAAYMVTNYVLYLQRFMLTLHFTEHRPLFKPGAPSARCHTHA